MPSLAQAQTALDNRAILAFAGSGAVLLHGNQSDSEVSQGSAPYIRFRVVFSTNRQLQLGRREADAPCPRRNEGYVLIVIHTRKGTGDGQRNSRQERVNQPFPSRTVGGVTLRGARVVSVGETVNWAILGIQIPFHFDQYEV